MTDTIEVLKAARELISDPKHWTQYLFARDDNGNSTQPVSVRAVCWCALGAIDRVSGDDESAGDDALDALMEVVEEGNVSTFNDSHTHPEVMALFDAAIARLA